MIFYWRIPHTNLSLRNSTEVRASSCCQSAVTPQEFGDIREELEGAVTLFFLLPFHPAFHEQLHSKWGQGVFCFTGLWLMKPTLVKPNHLVGPTPSHFRGDFKLAEISPLLNFHIFEEYVFLDSEILLLRLRVFLGIFLSLIFLLFLYKSTKSCAHTGKYRFWYWIRLKICSPFSLWEKKKVGGQNILNFLIW